MPYAEFYIKFAECIMFFAILGAILSLLLITYLIWEWIKRKLR